MPTTSDAVPLIGIYINKKYKTKKANKKLYNNLLKTVNKPNQDHATHLDTCVVVNRVLKKIAHFFRDWVKLI